MKSSAYPPPDKPSYKGYLPLIFTSKSSATPPPLFFKNLNAHINEGVYTRRTMVSSRQKISIDLHCKSIDRFLYDNNDLYCPIQYLY